MALFIVLAAMRGRFVADSGHTYDNFQMMGYAEASSPQGAVGEFFDHPQFPIQWRDVEYLWAERLTNDPENGHHGDYTRVTVNELRRRMTG
jgi:hypothetical protein